MHDEPTLGTGLEHESGSRDRRGWDGSRVVGCVRCREVQVMARRVQEADGRVAGQGACSVRRVPQEDRSPDVACGPVGQDLAPRELASVTRSNGLLGHAIRDRCIPTRGRNLPKAGSFAGASDRHDREHDQHRGRRSSNRSERPDTVRIIGRRGREGPCPKHRVLEFSWSGHDNPDRISALDARLSRIIWRKPEAAPRV